MATRTITHNTADLPLHVGDIVVTEQSRFWTLENLRVQGSIYIGSGCSHYAVRNVRVDGGGIVVAGLNFHGNFSRVWVANAPGIAFDLGTLSTNGNHNAMIYESCFAQGAKSLGWFVKAQTGLVMLASSADQCEGGGFLFSSCVGSFEGLTAESNGGQPFRFYDSHGVITAPFVDPPTPGAILIDGGSTCQVVGRKA